MKSIGSVKGGPFMTVAGRDKKALTSLLVGVMFASAQHLLDSGLRVIPD